MPFGKRGTRILNETGYIKEWIRIASFRHTIPDEVVHRINFGRGGVDSVVDTRPDQKNPTRYRISSTSRKSQASAGGGVYGSAKGYALQIDAKLRRLILTRHPDLLLPLKIQTSDLAVP